MPEPDAPRPKRGWLHLATVDITPLRRHRDFRLLYVGRLVSFFGSMITVVAFPYQVYLLTHSVLLVGFLGLPPDRDRLRRAATHVSESDDSGAMAVLP